MSGVLFCFFFFFYQNQGVIIMTSVLLCVSKNVLIYFSGDSSRERGVWPRSVVA